MLRPYQQEAVDNALEAIRMGRPGVLCLATGCWAKGTPIKMADESTKPIEEIRNGDRVLSFDEFSKTITTSTVQSVIKTSLNPKPMIELEYEETYLPRVQDANNNADSISKISTKAGEKDILLGEVRNKGTTTNKVRATFDHPFYDGEGFLPLYQLIWGALEESQRVQLKLLCQQYGQACDPKQKRRKHSCCNESCPRCTRLLQNSDGRQDCKSSSDCSRELVAESYEVSCSEPHKWGQSRQPSGESGMVHSSIQCMAWLPLRSDKVEPRVQPEQETIPRGHRVPERILPRTHRGEAIGDKKGGVRQAAKNVPDRRKMHNPALVQWRAKVLPSEPYYAIVLEQAPHTYVVGHGAGFLVHNSGKSHIVAGICQHLDNALIIAPSKELVVQNHSKLEQAFKEVAPDKVSELGIYSAGLGKRELKPYTFATVNSVYKLGDKLKMFDTVLIDEGDLANPRKGMYKTVLDTIGTRRVIALTATPFRFEHQVKYGPQGVATRSTLRTMMSQGYFKDLLANVSTKDLMDAGYLSRIEYYKDPVGQAYTKSLRMNSQGTDYTEESLSYYGEQTAKHIAQKANRAIETGFCKKVLVFAVNIAIAERIAELAHCHCITGETKAKDRDKWLQEYKDASTGVMVNVATLTTGVDIPSVDCIILARPTKSPRLYQQVTGRGIRLDPNNPDKVCKLIDETNTVEHLGRVEDMYIRDNQLYSAGRRLTDVPGRTIVIKRRKHGNAR